MGSLLNRLPEWIDLESELNACTAAPYHLINTTVNLPTRNWGLVARKQRDRKTEQEKIRPFSSLNRPRY